MYMMTYKCLEDEMSEVIYTHKNMYMVVIINLIM